MIFIPQNQLKTRESKMEIGEYTIENLGNARNYGDVTYYEAKITKKGSIMVIQDMIPSNVSQRDMIEWLNRCNW
jgi:CTP-dependent riboflavin kinase